MNLKIKPKVLFVGEGITLAHPTRMFQFAKNIHPDQFEIHFACPKSYWGILNSPHIQNWALPTVPSATILNRFYHVKYPYTVQELKTNLEVDLKLLDQIRPDVVISDFRLTMPIAAKKLKIYCANLIQYYATTSYRQPVLVPRSAICDFWGRDLTNIFAPIVHKIVQHAQIFSLNLWRKSIGLKPFANIYDSYGEGDYLLCPDLPELFDQPQFSRSGQFIPPLLWSTSFPLPDWWSQVDFQRPTALVSMGSSGVNASLPVLLRALLERNWQVLLATGEGPKVDIDTSPQKGLLWQAPYIPVDQVTPKCHLMVCNGGTSMTYLALKNAIPIFAIPSNMDQYLNMDLLKKHGVADYVNMDQLTVNSVQTRVSELVENQISRDTLISIRESLDSCVETFDWNGLIHSFLSRMSGSI